MSSWIGDPRLGLHVRSLDALVHTSYGGAMLVKAALFLLAGLSGLIVTVGLRWRRGGRLGSAWAALPGWRRPSWSRWWHRSR